MLPFRCQSLSKFVCNPHKYWLYQIVWIIQTRSDNCRKDFSSDFSAGTHPLSLRTKETYIPEHLQRPAILPPHQCTAVVFKREPGLLGRYLYLAAKKHRRSRVIKFHSKIRTYFLSDNFSVFPESRKSCLPSQRIPGQRCCSFYPQTPRISLRTRSSSLTRKLNTMQRISLQ